MIKWHKISGNKWHYWNVDGVEGTEGGQRRDEKRREEIDDVLPDYGKCCIMCSIINRNDLFRDSAICFEHLDKRSAKRLSMMPIKDNSSCQPLLRSFAVHFRYLTLILIQRQHALTAGWKCCSIFCKYIRIILTQIWEYSKNDSKNYPPLLFYKQKDH